MNKRWKMRFHFFVDIYFSEIVFFCEKDFGNCLSLPEGTWRNSCPVFSRREKGNPVCG